MIRIPAVTFQEQIASEDVGSALPPIDREMIHNIVDKAPEGELDTTDAIRLIEALGISSEKEILATNLMQAKMAAIDIGYPVKLQSYGEGIQRESVDNITDENTMRLEFKRLMLIHGAQGAILSPSMNGKYHYFGIRHKPKTGHIILFGIYDRTQRHPTSYTAFTVPLGREKVMASVKKVADFSQENEVLIVDTLRRLEALCREAPRIIGADIMPTVTGTRSIVATGVSVILK